MNTFGNNYRLTSFGESHGAAIGGVIDGMPAGVRIDTGWVDECMGHRRPGQSAVTSQRHEDDHVEFLSGIFEGVTTGTPIGFVIANNDTRSKDYEQLRHSFRPGHADYTYQVKYGHRDHRGGARASARETAARVVAGALAMHVLRQHGIEIMAWTSQIGDVTTAPYPRSSASDLRIDMQDVWNSPLRCPDPTAASRMDQALREATATGDTLGGIVTCVISNPPAGLGDPVFGKLQAQLAAAMMSIPAAKGFDYGTGFECVHMRGSEVIDEFIPNPRGGITTASNYSGGIQGGISNGRSIYMRVAFKPVATLRQPVPTVDDSGHRMTLEMSGRHDPCVVPRAVAVVQAMAACVTLDALLGR